MRLANRLCPPHCVSPYLLQHRHNPVHWQPWDSQAFHHARQLDRPVFLSIGYSTCHWCHVMARESFSNESVAQVLNDRFVAIKVDREERPDVDRQYMGYVQAVNGHGGWPLSVWMTPQGRPFYGCTYLRPEEFVSVCERISQLWLTKRDEILKVADRDWQALKLSAKSDTERVSLSVDPRPLFEYYEDTFDEEFGGFTQTRNGPKFPMPLTITFLLHYHKRYNDQRALEMAMSTALNMSDSVLHDHLEGGFHRYCVDRQWSTPHFEKMLYDQALLLEAFTLLYTVSRDPKLLVAMNSIYKYVDERLKSENGQFYCAEDAESLIDNHKEDGAFAVWTVEQLKSLLSENDFDLVSDTFGISPQGNAINLADKNCLNKLKGVEGVEKLYDNYEARLTMSLKVLSDARQKRPRPHRDEKIMTAWNALMISALAKASLYIPGSLQLAERAFQQTIDNGKKIMRTETAAACADDYAFLVKAALDLNQVTLKQEYLDNAVQIHSELVKLFSNENDDAFYYSQPDPENIVIRAVDNYDGVEPSANSIALYNLKLLDSLGLADNNGYKEMYERMVRRFSRQLVDSPMSLSMMMTVVAMEPVVVSVPTDHEYLQLSSHFNKLDLFYKRSTDANWQVCYKSACHGPFDTVGKVEEYLKSI